MSKLYIDTRDSGKVEVCLIKDKERICVKEVANKLRAQTTLPLIEKLLQQTNTKLSEIKEINVEQGPGSFTGVRVGISIANALAFSSLITVNGKRIGNIETANY